MLFDFFFSFRFFFLPFSVAFIHDGICRVKDCNNTRKKKTKKDYWVLDQVLVKVVFIFEVTESLVLRSFYFLKYVL